MSARVYPVYSELSRRGFYHPITVLILAAITLSIASIFFLNSKVLFKAPKSDQAQTNPIPKDSPSPESFLLDPTYGENYTNHELGFSINYPFDWNIENLSENDKRIFAVSKDFKSETSNDFNRWQEGQLTLSIFADKTNYSQVDQYLNETYKPNKYGLPDAKSIIASSTRRNIGGVGFIISPSGDNFENAERTAWFIHNGYLFKISMSFGETGSEPSQEGIIFFNQMINSIKLTK